MSVETPVSFRSLYDQYAGMVYRYVLAKTGRSEAAEDILQEVFLGLWKQRRKLPRIQSYRPWIFRIAHNKVIDYYRRVQLQKSYGSESYEYQNLASPASDEKKIFLDSINLAKARNGLTRESQKLLDLIYYFDLTYEETAKLLGIPMGTLKSRMHNLRKTMKMLAGRKTSRVQTGAQKRKQCSAKMAKAVVYCLPDMDKVKVASVVYSGNLKMDIYYPSDFTFETTLPVIVNVMGYSDEGFMRFAGMKLKDLTACLSWGQLSAAAGMISVTYETDDPDRDIHELLEFLHCKGNLLGIDGNRICLWACSGNVMTALQALTEVERPYASSIKCGVLYYPVFSDLQRNLVDVNAVIERSLRKDLPLLLVEVGKEHLEFRRGAELFTEKIHSTGMPLEHIYYADGVHGFDSQMDNPETRRIVRRTLDYMQQHLS